MEVISPQQCIILHLPPFCCHQCCFCLFDSLVVPCPAQTRGTRRLNVPGIIYTRCCSCGVGRCAHSFSLFSVPALPPPQPFQHPRYSIPQWRPILFPQQPTSQPPTPPYCMFDPTISTYPVFQPSIPPQLFPSVAGLVVDFSFCLPGTTSWVGARNPRRPRATERLPLLPPLLPDAAGFPRQLAAFLPESL